VERRIWGLSEHRNIEPGGARTVGQCFRLSHTDAVCVDGMLRCMSPVCSPAERGGGGGYRGGTSNTSIVLQVYMGRGELPVSP